MLDCFQWYVALTRCVFLLDRGFNLHYYKYILSLYVIIDQCQVIFSSYIIVAQFLYKVYRIFVMIRIFETVCRHIGKFRELYVQYGFFTCIILFQYNDNINQTRS